MLYVGPSAGYERPFRDITALRQAGRERQLLITAQSAINDKKESTKMTQFVRGSMLDTDEDLSLKVQSPVPIEH